MYEYKAIVTKVYDGDTITVDIDLGFGIWTKKQTIRLFGINTPEVRGDEKEQGYISRDRLREWVLGKEVILVTAKDKKGKYGRWLGSIYPYGEFMSETIEGSVSYNQRLINEGLAEKYM